MRTAARGHAAKKLPALFVTVPVVTKPYDLPTGGKLGTVVTGADRS